MAERMDQYNSGKMLTYPFPTQHFLSSEKLMPTLDYGEGEGSFPESSTTLKE